MIHFPILRKKGQDLTDLLIQNWKSSFNEKCKNATQVESEIILIISTKIGTKVALIIWSPNGDILNSATNVFTEQYAPMELDSLYNNVL